MPSSTATTGGVTVDAENTSSINATETTSLNSGGDSKSILAAFNVVGWSNENLGHLTVAALLGTSSLLGTKTPDKTQAFIDASTVTAALNVEVTANGAATITVDAGDSGTAQNGSDLLFSAKGGPTSLELGALLATNMVATQTTAYIDNGTGTTTVTATAGHVNVHATDQATDTASSVLNLTAVTTSNENALYQIAVQLAHQDYIYTDKSGSQFVNDGNQVYAGQDSGGNPLIYQYKGPTTTTVNGNNVPLAVDLGAQNYSTDTLNWTKIEEGAPTLASMLPNLGNLTNANAKGVGALFVLNDVRGKADATVTGASLTAGTTIDLQANEAAKIEAFVENNISSTGGSSGITTVDPEASKSGSLSFAGAIATNLVLASALASADGATLSALSGIALNAVNAAQLDATDLVASSTGGGGGQVSVGLVIAFNSIGWDPENFLFNSADALVGTTYLGGTDPASATRLHPPHHDHPGRRRPQHPGAGHGAGERHRQQRRQHDGLGAVRRDRQGLCRRAGVQQGQRHGQRLYR